MSPKKSAGEIPIPPAFLAGMQRLLGEAETGALLQALSGPPQAGLRVNTLKLGAADFCALSPWPLEPVPWCPEGFRLPDEVAAGGHVFHAAGLYYLQEPSAMAVGALLAPQPGERVLDLAAAPGGKATHLAGLMQGQGWLVVNELHTRRAWELAENMERWGARHVAVLNETPERLAQHFGPLFDRVLLDAPCSGEGMFRKSTAARRDWSPEAVAGCAARQSEILEQAGKLVRLGGRLVYSTCTFNPQEDEGVVSRFLERGEFELVALPSQPGFAAGRPDWVEPPFQPLARAVRLWPHRSAGEGHFVAVMERTSSHSLQGGNVPAVLCRGGKGGRSPVHGRIGGQPASQKGLAGEPSTQQYFDEFWQGLLAGRLPEDGSLHLEGAYLYWLPQAALELSGLRAIHPGWWLGTIKPGRFEPAHALAMGLPAGEVTLRLELAVEDPRTLAYLRGETLRSPGPDGWLLVCVAGFPLGWGRRVAGVVKNAYPKGLRRAR